VIASNVGALPEVAGDAAYLTTPDSEALAQAMMSVISYPNIRRMLIENGYDRLLLYSWEKAARLVWQALQSERLIL
jgi:glycosyltransferase involved in cell wall biosynthesis